MKLDKSAVHHRVKKAIDRGHLVNREEKRGMPARIATADPLPDEIEILPDPDALEDRCSVEAPMEGIKEEEAEEDDASEPEQPEPLLPPDPHLNTSTPSVCSAPFYDPGPIPDCLRRAPPSNSNGSPPLCDHCGTPGNLTPWDWPNRPDGIVLHSSCEAPWFDSKGAQHA
jgi:hypothetical protein